VLNSGAKLDMGAGGSGSIAVSTVSVASGATNTKLRLASTGTATISQAVTGLAELELSDGNSVFSQDVGSPSTRIGAITRTSTAGTTTFSRNLYATNFNGSGGALSFLGSTTDITNAVTFGTAAMVVLGDGGDTLNFPGGLVHTAGPTTIGGTVTTTNTGITLGDVVIPAAATLSTGTGAGDIDMWAVTGSGSLTRIVRPGQHDLPQHDQRADEHHRSAGRKCRLPWCSDHQWQFDAVDCRDWHDDAPWWHDRWHAGRSNGGGVAGFRHADNQWGRFAHSHRIGQFKYRCQPECWQFNRPHFGWRGWLRSEQYITDQQRQQSRDRGD
jgi:hypothetical protein